MALTLTSTAAAAADPDLDLDPARQPARPRLVASVAAGTAPGSWSERGSSNQAGRTQITVVSSDGNSLLIGTAGGSIFGGSAKAGWQARADNLGFGGAPSGVRHLLIAPGAPEIWLAAAYFADIAVSTNLGASWSAPTGLPLLSDIFRMVHDAANPHSVYLLAATSSAQAQLFHSADGGQTFTGLATFPIDGINGIVGLDLWTSRTATGPLFVMLENGQLETSADFGATFSPLGKAGPGDTDMAVLGGSEAGSPTLYALLAKDFQNWNLYASDDGGKTWQQRFALAGIFYSGNGGIGTSMRNPKLVVFGRTRASSSPIRPRVSWRSTRCSAATSAG